MEILGYVGSILLMLCGAPLAIQAVKTQKRPVMNIKMFWMWYFGEWFSLAYVLLKFGFNGPLIANYGMNIVFLTAVLFYED